MSAQAAPSHRPLHRTVRRARGWVARRWLGLLLVLVGAASGVGCPGGSNRNGPSNAAKTPEEARRRGQLRDLRDNVDRLQLQIKDFPLNKTAVIHLAREHRASAQKLGAKDLEASFQRIEEEAKTAFDRAARTETDKGIADAREKIKAGEIDEAISKLRALSEQLEGTTFATAVDHVLADARLAKRGGAVYSNVIDPKLTRFESEERWELAQGLLESFTLVEPFKLNPKAKEVAKKLEAVRPKAEAARVRRQKERAIEWSPIFHGKKEDLENLQHADYQSTGMDGDVMTFKATDEPARLTFGDESWGDVIVEVKLEILEGKIHFLCRGALTDGAVNWQRAGSFESYDLEKDTMTKIRFEVRGDTARYTVFSQQPDTAARGVENANGPFQILLEPGGKVRIKEIWAKVLTKVKLPGQE